MFDPLDPALWPMGADLAWWDSAGQLADGLRPSWATDPVVARARLRRPLVLRALALIHAHRTVTTGQLHRLDARLPARPDSLLWRDMIGLGLVDVGFVMSATGRWRATPAGVRLMGVRLPTHRTVEPILESLGFTPVETLTVGPAPLRGARQYARHNLICTELSCRFRDVGVRTLGEAWCRFDLMFHDFTAGRGGPDLAVLRSDGLAVCVEATASETGLMDKAARWTRLLDGHPDAAIRVVWLDCSAGLDRASSVRSKLARLPGAGGRMRVADARRWLDGGLGVLDDGTNVLDWDAPGRRRADPERWMRRSMGVVAAGFGLDGVAAESWPLPDRLKGGWLA